jgi:CheY-like chemotaxis protein
LSIEKKKRNGKQLVINRVGFVLVVEDEPLHAKLLERVFSRVEVEVAAGGAEAMQIMSQRVPSCVVLDLNMPGIDGWQVAQWIKSQAHLKNVPVVVVTAYHEDGFEKRATDMGLDGYIRKPVALDKFIELTGRVMPIDLLRALKEPCLICGRTGNALLDVTTVSEATTLWGKAAGVLRTEAGKWSKGVRRSGRHWLLAYSVAASNFGNEEFAWHYWLAPDYPCPGCSLTGDPLREVMGITDDLVKEYGPAAVDRVRYGVSTGDIIARKAGYFWLMDRASAESWLRSLGGGQKD